MKNRYDIVVTDDSILDNIEDAVAYIEYQIFDKVPYESKSIVLHLTKAQLRRFNDSSSKPRFDEAYPVIVETLTPRKAEVLFEDKRRDYYRQQEMEIGFMQQFVNVRSEDDPKPCIISYLHTDEGAFLKRLKGDV